MQRGEVDDYLEKTRERINRTLAVRNSINKNMYSLDVWRNRLKLDLKTRLYGWEIRDVSDILWSAQALEGDSDDNKEYVPYKAVAVVSSGRIDTFENNVKKKLDPFDFVEEQSPILKPVLILVIRNSIGFDLRELILLSWLNKKYHKLINSTQFWNRLFHYDVLLQHIHDVASPFVRKIVNEYKPIKLLNVLYPFRRQRESFGMPCYYKEASYDWNTIASEARPDDILIFHTIQTLLVLKIFNACVKFKSLDYTSFGKDGHVTLAPFFSHDFFQPITTKRTSPITIRTGQSFYPSALELGDVRIFFYSGDSELLLLKRVRPSSEKVWLLGSWNSVVAPLLVWYIKSWLENGKHGSELDWTRVVRAEPEGFCCVFTKGAISTVLQKK